MIFVFSSVTALLLGTTMAYIADRFTALRVVLETAGGLLIIGGLGIIGFEMCQWQEEHRRVNLSSECKKNPRL